MSVHTGLHAVLRLVEGVELLVAVAVVSAHGVLDLTVSRGSDEATDLCVHDECNNEAVETEDLAEG